MEVNFGDILRNRRKNIGMNQEKLVKNISGDRTYISRLESYDSNPNFDTIKKICDGLGLTLEEFFREEVEKELPILELYRDTERKKPFKKYRVKAGMIAIKVVKDLNSFSRDRIIKEELTSKYIYVDKGMIHNSKDVLGVEIEKDFVISSFKLKKVIFLIDIVHKDLVNFGFYLVEIEDPGEVFIMRVEEKDDKIIFFEESSDEKRKSLSYIPKPFKILDKSKLDADLIRGKIVSIMGKL